MAHDWPTTITALRERLSATYQPLIELARSGAPWLAARPEPAGWTGAEVLEHVALTDHFLLRLVQKIGDKAAMRAERGNAWPTDPPEFDHLEAIAAREHSWPHPEHMTPTGELDLAEIARRLGADLAFAHAWLDRQPSGEGTLHRIRMSVVGDAGAEDDRLHLYHFLAVIELHARRHGAQLARLRNAAEQK
ncbi:hypothetical protein Poly30_09300 [Planctomycetes bacterium Poly30]|uniref:Uncharacterized protein n=2 Tax=Saltatorellus ferox TaxID=2528018 RepID=A0A518EMX0_9BACT|nr:hypothetical protein Poly30_09300 [Planctomycetes bacterium Poly30]